jgi:Leucine-rich repeat (LRR) protein
VKGQVDFSKGQNYLKAEVMNEQRVFVLTTPDYKIMIPFSGQLKLEKQPEMSYEEMNTPMQESEKSSAYRRAESTLEHPNSNKIQLVGLGLTSKEITSLLSQYSEKLEDISDLEINLGDNDITTFPTILLNMKTLKSVNLDNNRIKAFPKNNPSKKVEIKKEKCPNLQEISLDRNNLSTFTDEFLELDQIKHLSLNDNRFSELPSDISKLEHLKDLQIRENQLSKLPESITTLKELRSLQASRCGLTELPADFNKLKNLTVL